MSHITGRMHLMQGKMGLVKMHIRLRRSGYLSSPCLFFFFLFHCRVVYYLHCFNLEVFLFDIILALQGCDCLGYIKYFDAHFTNFNGGVDTIENCVCMHEEDHGILWKHHDWRTGLAEVRRSRRLTVSFICTVANYEYGFFWHFYQVS